MKSRAEKIKVASAFTWQSWAIWSAHSYPTMCRSSGQKLCLPNSKHEEDLTPWLIWTCQLALLET